MVDTLQAIIDGRSDVFIGLGGNFVAAVPDTAVVKEAMRRLKLTVGINTKLNRTHIVHGEAALILPCFARSDIDIQATGRQSITVEGSMSMVHASGGLVTPPSSNLKSEVAIVCGMARATLPGSGIDRDAFEGNYDLICDKIEAVFPKLFAGFNARTASPGGFISKASQNREWNTTETDAPTSSFARASQKIRRFKIPRRCNSQRSAATNNTTRQSTPSTTATAASLAAEWWSS